MFKPTTKQKAELRKLIQKWRPLLYLHNWTIDCHYMDSNDPDSPDCAIRTSMMSEYFEATWTVYPKFFTLDARMRERTVIHEFCHSVVLPLYHLANIQNKGQFVSPGHSAHIDEQVTSHLTTIIADLKGIDKL